MTDHVKTVASVYEAFGRGDVPFILNCLAEHVGWDSWADNYGQRAGVPWLAERRGRAAVAGFFEVIGAWEFKRFEVLSVMAGERQVAAEIGVHVKFPSGAEMAEEEIHLWTFDEAGKISRFRHYADTAKHIEAARLAG